MITVGKHFILVRQIGATGIDEVDTWQIVCPGNFLGSKVLLHGNWKISATLHSRIVSNNHAFPPLDTSNTCNDARRSDTVVI